MKENPHNIIVDKLKKRMTAVKERIQERYKGAAPFRKEIVPLQERRFIYSGLSQQDIAMGLEKSRQFYANRIEQVLGQYPEEQREIARQQMYVPEEMAREDMNEFIFENEQLLKGGGK